MIKRLYDWMMSLAGSRQAPHALFWVSFAESSFFPIPPDVMLIPMILKDRAKAWRYAALATIASVLGGIAGYAIGYFLFESLGKSVMNLYGLTAKYDQAAAWFNEWGVAILIVKGMTPIPYKLLTITAGAVHMNLLAFIGASIIARSMRFFLVAALLYWFGEPIRDFIERRLTLVTTAAVVLLVSGFVVVKFIA
jgi:membrane protein YqaA with SNARE-associated domain